MCIRDRVTVFGYTAEAALKIVEYGLGDLRLSRKTPRLSLIHI